MGTVLGEAVWAISGNLDGLRQALEEAGREVSKATQGMDKHLATVGKSMTAVGAGITAALGLSVRTAADFEQAITNAASVMGLSGDEFLEAKGKMEALAMTLGQTTVFSATEAANAFYDLASKGFDVAKMSVSELAPILDLAAATQADLSIATETLTSTLRAFGLANSETSRIADVFVKTIGSSAASIDKLAVSMNYVAPVAKAAGISLEETNAHLAQLYNAGLDGSMAGTALRGVFMELMSPSDALVSKWQTMGRSIDELSIETHGLNGVLQTLRTSGLSSADMLDIFGARAGPASLTLLETADSAKILTGELLEAGGSARQVAEQQLDTLSGQLKLLGSAIESVVIPIGQALIPALGSVVASVTPVLQSIANWMGENQALTQTLVVLVGIVGTLMVTLGPLFMMIPGLITLITALKAIFLALGVAVGVATVPIWGTVAVVVGVLAAIGAAVALLWNYWDVVVDGVKWLWEKVVGYFLWGWEKVKAVFGWIMDAAGALAGYLGFGGGGNITMRAEGGPVKAGHPYLVGEKGPELFVPGSSGTVVPNEAVGNEIQIHFNGDMNVRSEQDIQELSRRLASDIQQELGYVL